MLGDAQRSKLSAFRKNALVDANGLQKMLEENIASVA